ncbi:MAG: Integral rane sensor signal transduction histidine kinase [Pedosphaera sp.]|nr:Integral rane sensor signal transduction histidine kinase [Pedosphaera sp.]
MTSYFREPGRRVGLSVAIAFCFCVLSWPVEAQKPAEELRTVAAIRGLTVEQTHQKIAVRLRAVVTFFNEDLYSRFIQDDTAGIYLQFPTNFPSPPLAPGQVVEITGTANPGEYAPVVVPNQLRVVGEAAFPMPKLVTYDQLASGTEDSQFVEIAGIVRSVRIHEASKYYQIEITTGERRLLVYAKQLPVKRADELLDCTVRVRGVCSTEFNHRRQLFAIRLMVPRADDLEVEVPTPKDPFALAARPIGSLLQFTPQETYGHRAKVAGTVIYYEPGAAIFLQDGEHGLEVQTKETTPLQLGDRVEALGFVKQGEYTPVLQDAIFRKLSSGKTPELALVTPDEALTGNHDCQLIQVSAKLIDHATHGSEQYLILEESDSIFQAFLRQADDRAAFAGLENGSRVAVRGVCRIDPGEWRAGDDWRAKSFSIQLRSVDDLAVLQPPPWWTLRKVFWIAGALGFVALAAFSWVAVLRRQVVDRTRELEIQIQKRQLAERKREIEQERARVAHDLHDDLGSGLTEVNMLCALAESPTTSAEEKSRYLDQLTETARRMVTSLDEIVWAVNPRNDTIASLASYFGSYAQRLLDIASVACGLDIAHDLPEHPLDPKFRQELFFAFKEALTNVIRHAGATQVWLRISVSENHLVAEVADNGCGFNLMERQAGDDGIANMKERMKSLGGDCEILSDAQKGTTICFRAPLPRRLL